jgi:hypothetical protein
VDVGELGPFFGEQTNVLIRGFGQEFRKIRDPILNRGCLVAVGDTRLRASTHPGEPPADFDNSLRFGKGILHLAGRNPAVHELMIRVRQLVGPRSALADPDLLRRVGSTRVPDGPAKCESGRITAPLDEPARPAATRLLRP